MAAPKAAWVPPPSSFTVFEPPPRPVLFRADGKPLVRRPAGFDTRTT